MTPRVVAVLVFLLALLVCAVVIWYGAAHPVGPGDTGPLQAWVASWGLSAKMAAALGFSVALALLFKLLSDLRAHKRHLEALVAVRTAELEASETDLKRAQAAGRVGSWAQDLTQGRLTRQSPVIWSAETYRIFGVPVGTAVDLQMFMDHVHPDDRVELEQHWRQAIKGQRYDLEFRIVVGGEVRRAHSQLDFVFDRNGRAERCVGSLQDVTERWRNDVAQRVAKDRLTALIEAIPDAIFFKDGQGHWLITNEAGQRRFKLQGFDWYGKTDGQMAVERPGYRELHRACIIEDEKAWNSPEPVLVQQRMVNEAGGVRVFEVRMLALRDDVGERRALVVLDREITKIRQAEVELHNAVDALNDSLERTKLLLDAALDAVINMDQDGCVIGWNHQAEAIFGYTAAQAMGRDVADLIVPPRSRQAHRDGMARYMRTSTPTIIGRRVEVIGMRADGSEFPIELTVAALQRHGVFTFSAYVRDITSRKLAEGELRIAAAAFDAQEGMVITDPDGTIERVNQAFTAITGYCAEEAVGKNTSLLKSGRHSSAFFGALWHDLLRHGVWQGELWNRRKNGEVYPQWLGISAVRDVQGEVTHYVGMLSDITVRKAAEAEIRQLAFYDSLTNLPNRRMLTDRLKQALASARRNQSHGALLFIDLDHFKTLNDTMGHAQGDFLLQQVAGRLNAAIREGDTVARLGGDEFVVMLQNLDANVTDAASQAEAVGEKVLAALRAPYQFNTLVHHGSASLGIALFDDRHDSVDELLKRADLALYQAKDGGRNTLRFFDPDMQVAVTARAALEVDLRYGLEHDQLRLHYQPQVNDQGRLTGAEALVRWQHPEYGLVMPGRFISMAEQTGLILPLGHWVLETACAQLAQWSRQEATAHLTLAVNVSPRQFHREHFVDEVLAVLQNTGAPASRLKLELTESLLVSDVEDIIRKMAALKRRGVGFSLDDFGTGYSSLTYLKRLPLDQLKIDQSFLCDALTNPDDAAIASAIIALGQSLGMMVIAEGVETPDQRDFLRGEGCYNYQGFLFGHPGPIESLAPWIVGPKG
ncbi:MAG: EAL domain-containing protein [Rhodoferax sp.]|nr:EAL domain-containing protein [Rhodoferax sp.]